MLRFVSGLVFGSDAGASSAADEQPGSAASSASSASSASPVEAAAAASSASSASLNASSKSDDVPPATSMGAFLESGEQEVARGVVRLSIQRPDGTLDVRCPVALMLLVRFEESYDFELRVLDDEEVLLRQTLNSSLPTDFSRSNHSISWMMRIGDKQENRVFCAEFLHWDEETYLKQMWGIALWEASNQDSFFKVVKDTKWMYEPEPADDTQVTDMADDALDFDDTASTTSSSTSSSAAAQKISDMALATVLNRAFVSRSNGSIGMYRQTDVGQLDYLNEIPVVADLSGQALLADKLMLHQQDEKMLLLSETRPDAAMLMDIEKGVVVSELGDGTGQFRIRNIAATSKYGERTAEQTFLGINKTDMFTIDPRLNTSNKVAVVKSYATPVNFSAAVATGDKCVAVASSKGELRLYNGVGKNARSALPGVGDAIVGLDVTENGEWVLATCVPYLLLFRTRNADDSTNGFANSITKHASPPVKLSLLPKDLLKLGIDSPSFTTARFNTGDNINEEWIVTSTGPYIVVFNFRKIKSNPERYRHEYTIKRAQSNVVAEQFLYGRKEQVVVADDQDVYLEKRTMRKSGVARR